MEMFYKSMRICDEIPSKQQLRDARLHAITDKMYRNVFHIDARRLPESMRRVIDLWLQWASHSLFLDTPVANGVIN